MNMDMYNKARSAASPEELLKIAEEYGVKMDLNQAKEYFSQLSGEISDSELEEVAGGCGDSGKKDNRVLCPKCKKERLDKVGTSLWKCPNCGRITEDDLRFALVPLPLED